MMDMNLTTMLIYAGLAVGGYAVRWLQNRNAQPTQPPIVPLPGPDGELRIGNGLLLSLIVNAVKAGMGGLPTVPGQPTPPVIPAVPAPQPQPVDLNELLKLLQKLLNAPPPTQPPA